MAGGIQFRHDPDAAVVCGANDACDVAMRVCQLLPALPIISQPPFELFQIVSMCV